MLNKKLVKVFRGRKLAWVKLGLLVMLYMTMFVSVAYADDCLSDITRAED